MNWARHEKPEKKAEDIKDLINLLKEHKVKIKYDAVYEYKDHKKAFEEAKTKKVILVPRK